MIVIAQRTDSLLRNLLLGIDLKRVVAGCRGMTRLLGIGVACDDCSGAWAFAEDKDFTIEERQVEQCDHEP